MTDPSHPETETQGAIPVDRVLSTLTDGEMELEGQFLWGSNYTFLARVTDDDLSLYAVYKPTAGERPLWDFDRDTLGRREAATYLLSAHLGWPAVPPTVLRDGPHGPGSVQLFIDADHEENFFSLRERGGFKADFQQIVLFDYLINNADRKGGHCLLGHDGRIWSIDHGLTFHQETKLRTVIWDYAGRPIPAGWLDDLRALRDQLTNDHSLQDGLAHLLSPPEIEALHDRLEYLLHSATFPKPGPGRNVPYPLV